MKLNIETPTLRPWLRAIEPSLPMLATRAAIELDAQRRGRMCAMDAVRELSELVRNSVDQDTGGGSGQQFDSLMDPGTMVMVGRALKAIPDKRVTKIAELQNTLREIAGWLDQSATNSNASHAAVLRDFCLALAGGASAHHQDFRDEKPTHPYRR